MSEVFLVAGNHNLYIVGGHRLNVDFIFEIPCVLFHGIQHVLLTDINDFE